MLIVGVMIGAVIQEFSKFTGRNCKKRGCYTKKNVCLLKNTHLQEWDLHCVKKFISILKNISNGANLGVEYQGGHD